MDTKTPIFFCAIGGSGMLPLALVMKSLGYDVSGSDRSYDQGRTPERFAFLKSQGIQLFPQDGSGVTEKMSGVVVSTAVEPTVPDYQAAIQKKVPIIHRAALLADLFNQAPMGIAIAGTSGKSTTTGMVGWMLHKLGHKPTVVNGAAMKNFMTESSPYASAVIGDASLFVAEVDESDGSIAHFNPEIAVLNNIALDHKSMDELRALFRDFLDRSDRVVLNLDNAETAAICGAIKHGRVVTYSLDHSTATLFATNLSFQNDGISFDVVHENETISVKLRVTGAHNVSNALAALGVALSLKMDLREAAQALEAFTGIARRLDVVGTSKGVTVIDDFAHNPDKITASLRALHQYEGRLFVVFQPHGFGPLRMMRREFADCFSAGMGKADRLLILPPLYLGGTTDKSVTSEDLVKDLSEKGCAAVYAPDREGACASILQEATSGDRIVIMGARDDTLTTFAKDIWQKI